MIKQSNINKILKQSNYMKYVKKESTLLNMVTMG